MPDHEFEKRIQEKMAELKLRPSEPVWDRVEQQLHKKEKRRRGLLWLPLLIAALTGIYFLSDRVHFSNDVVADKEISAKPENLRDIDKTITEKFNQANPKQQDGVIKDPLRENDTLTASPYDPNVTGANPTNSEKANTEKINYVRPGHDKNLPSKITRTTALSRNKQFRENSGERTTIISEEKNELSTRRTSHTEAEVGVVSPLARELKPSIIDPILHPSWEIDIFRKITPPILKPVEKRIAAQKKRKMEIGISFTAGRSHLNDGKLNDLFENKSLSNSRISLQNSPNSGPVTPAGIYVPPSELKPGFAFSAGGYIRKQVTNGIHISAGLNYKYYSSSNKVGTSKDSTLPTYQTNGAFADMQTTIYRTGTTNNYTNRFHFIELPILADGRLVNGKFPVLWNAGLTYSRLLATNAVHYNSDYRLYYKDNNLFQKNQVNLHAGLSTTLLRNAKNSLKVGPEMSYGITDLLKGNRTDPRHFLFLGLKASMPINN